MHLLLERKRSLMLFYVFVNFFDMDIFSTRDFPGITLLHLLYPTVYRNTENLQFLCCNQFKLER